MNKRLCFFGVGLLAVCQFGLLVAMGQTTSGDITGRVVDPKGEPLVNIEVTLVNQLTGAERVEATGDSGDFAFASEQPGTFSVLVKAPGFKVLTKRDLVLTASERLSAGNLQLQIGAIEETVTVQAETTPVQTTSSERSALLDKTQLETLMTQGRTF